MKREAYPSLKFNFFVNLLDGGFFGMAIGFASFMTVLPLFVSTLTDSATLIGLIPAIHSVGWQFPQLFTAERVGRLNRLKPMVLFMTIQERVPFLGLGLVALFLPVLGSGPALVLTYLLLIWQGIGGGLTATAWQSMIAKIMPPNLRGTFFGSQAAAANLLMSGSAILAGIILTRYQGSTGYAYSFFLASLAMIVSFVFLAQTREAATPPENMPVRQGHFRDRMLEILRRDIPFRWFLIVRMLSQVAVMAFAFYIVYAVRRHALTEATAGLMTSVYTLGQIFANPLLGWVGDRWSHQAVMKLGALCASASALLAWLAPDLSWFYLVLILAGIANVSIWTIGMAMTLQFGSEADRPVYIGMANTLTAPSTILAPIIGGWLADTAGFQATFILSAAGGAITALLLHFIVRIPNPVHPQHSDEATT